MGNHPYTEQFPLWGTSLWGISVLIGTFLWGTILVRNNCPYGEPSLYGTVLSGNILMGNNCPYGEHPYGEQLSLWGTILIRNNCPYGEHPYTEQLSLWGTSLWETFVLLGNILLGNEELTYGVQSATTGHSHHQGYIL